MNGTPHELREQQRPAVEAEGERDPVDATGTPDVVEAAHVRRNGDHGTRGHQRRASGVEWVRPTDLIARHGAMLSGRGIDFEAELARRTWAPLGAELRHLGERARRLPPLSAFGRNAATLAGPVRSGVGMSR